MARNGNGNNGDEVNNNNNSQRVTVRIRSRADPFLIVWRCFRIVTSFAAILCIAFNALSAVTSFKNRFDVCNYVFDAIFRCYAVAIGFLVVLLETEWGFIFEFLRILEYWAGRGMLQIFVAVMTSAFPDASGEKKDLVLLQNIGTYILLACGVIYVISGILCIGFLKRSRQNEEITREQAAKELEENERRREELRASLVP